MDCRPATRVPRLCAGDTCAAAPPRGCASRPVPPPQLRASLTHPDACLLSNSPPWALFSAPITLPISFLSGPSGHTSATAVAIQPLTVASSAFSGRYSSISASCQTRDRTQYLVSNPGEARDVQALSFEHWSLPQTSRQPLSPLHPPSHTCRWTPCAFYQAW